MKRSILLGVIALFAASCTVQEADPLINSNDETEAVFYAMFEQPESPDTKVYANEQLLIRWHEDDRVSIFNQVTYNQQYQFTGKTGDNSGGFRKVSSDEFMTGNAIDDIVAVYPYQPETFLAEDEVLTMDLPAEQIYAPNTFGRGANTMMSVSSGNMLMFRNAGAYLMFSLYGDCLPISSITLKGNNNEKLSGKAYVSMPLNGIPSLQVVGDATEASNAITLRCEEPVTLGTTAGECTEFWFVVPPVTFSKGFTITIMQANGGTIERSTSKSVSLTRNKLSKMAPMEVEKAAPGMVDLGLSVKWGACNVGATFPEEPGGDYFAWGETEPKSDYSWSNYNFWGGEWSDDVRVNKYCTSTDFWGGTGPVDHKTVLDLEDDAAFVNWGSGWRMPTGAEWTELREHCTWVWTTQNGMQGELVTGPNGNSIFLPAAGNCTSPARVGVSGSYWSSSLYSKEPSDAWDVFFRSPDFLCDDSYTYRFYGFSVRPVYDDFIPVSAVSIDMSAIDLYKGDTYALTAAVAPSNATEKAVHWASGDQTVAKVDEKGLVTAVGAGSTTVMAYGSSGVYGTCEVTVTEGLTVNGYQYVDLGLPSGLKWARMNVGASQPAEFGDLFAWGETETYYAAGYAHSEDAVWKPGKESGYDYPSYKWCNGDYNKLTKYCTKNNFWVGTGTMDGKTVLDAEDDVASVLWGGSWRMPTEEEWIELLENCNFSFTNNYNGIGMSGVIITSKAEGYTKQSIFLPVAGYRVYLRFSGSMCIYWSSTLSSNNPGDARALSFTTISTEYSTDSAQWFHWWDDIRFCGHSVRPVVD